MEVISEIWKSENDGKWRWRLNDANNPDDVIWRSNEAFDSEIKAEEDLALLLSLEVVYD